MPLGTFLARLGDVLVAFFRAFVFPDLGLDLPAGLLTGLLVAGVALVVMGSLQALLGRGRHWVVFSVAAAAGAAAWVLLRGRHEVATFLVVIQVLLAFVGGAAFVWGLVESPWLPIGILIAAVLAAAGLVPAPPVATLLATLSSVLGVRSLLSRTEEWSPGRRGSRWNRRSAAGWVIALLAAGALGAGGLEAWNGTFKVAGMAAGAAMLATAKRRKRRSRKAAR